MRTRHRTIWSYLGENQRIRPGQLSVITNDPHADSAPFAEALKEGRLSLSKSSPNYIGHFAFAGRSSLNRPMFKNIHTGQFLV